MPALRSRLLQGSSSKSGLLDNTMLDLKLASDPATGVYDLEIARNGDLATVNDLSTAILTSLFTDARADPEQVVVPELRRGWVGDEEGFRLGSKLWLTEPAKATQQTMNIAAGFAREALQWLLDKDIAIAIDVEGEITGPRQGRLTIIITAPDGRTETQYVELWQNTAFVPSGLPAPIIEPVPFSPLAIPDIVVWGDAKFSKHDVDDVCGTITSKDITGTADYIQADPARRPLLLRGSGGWFYRFDGVDDFLATPNQSFPNLKEGSAFFIYWPAAGVTVGDRFFTLGFNGLTDSVGGLTFTQEASDVLRLRGDNGNLQVDVQGTGSSEIAFGVVFRWGDAAKGGDAETSTDQKGSDPGFTNEIGAPSQAILGAGFDGANPDPAKAGKFDLSSFAFWSRRISDAEVEQLLDYAETRLFVSSMGEPFSDCTYWTDDKGFA